MDASKDALSFYTVSLSTSEPDAGMMVESPKRDRTLVFSPSNNGLAIVSNAQESVALTMTLPGATESMFVWTDNTTAFIAVPSVPIAGQASPGGVGGVNISSGAITATLGIPGARFLVPSPDGSKILVISDSANAVTLLDPSLITTGNPLTPISGTFDKPVGAVFSADGSKAYVLNCGPECGGIAASVAVVDMNTSAIQGTAISVPGGATVALLQGTSLFVAGTPSAPANDCSGVTPATAATSCGRLTVVDTVALTPATPVTISDGYHDQMQMGANSQLFVGSRNCTNINISGGEVRGCLSILNTGTGGGVTAPPDNGNVTAIEPIPNRNVVYVCEGGALRIYDTTTDKLQTTPEQPNVVGQAIDVKVVDF
ncbi:MAG: hypothetical protein DMG98_10505 [Acidobacteria bacterium]|nr:MAG: hypothetical protein DMG98_10505 [Acidobacteriota bacterium]